MSAILVVDDERGIRESLNILLADEGHKVDLAENGREALTFIEKNTYDLVLTDIMMPEFDGMELLRQIKSKFNRRTSVIILTAFGTVQRAVEAVKEGAADFLIKPVDIQRLHDAVASALHHDEKELRLELQRREVETLHLKQLNQKLDRTIFELSILHEIGKTVNSTLEIDKIVSIILEMARQTVNADRASVVLYQRDKAEIKLNLTHSAFDETASSDLNLTDRRAVQWVTLNRQPLYVQDVQSNPALQQYLEGSEGLGSLLAVPLKRKAQTLGVIVLTSRTGGSRFLPEDLTFISTLANQAAIAIENAQLYEEIQDYFADTIGALVAAVEAKDTYTYGHSARVTRYSLMIGGQIGLNAVEQRRLEYLALLHDVGKIGIDEKILRKSEQLDDKEWAVIRNHPTIGGSIIRPIKFLPKGDRVIRHHHERFDGHGYPDGLSGEDIPLYSRIIAVADAFDAMTTLRPYRETLKTEDAIAELRRCSGGQFDPRLVSLFVNAFASADAAGARS
jgi:response regulator RpfG family c-di-GMP phosphodiesterase